MTYRLTAGPLALLATQALASPGKRHVMIIDEINRANLPKVLGELLFLLEYRDEQVRTLYRPDDAFELPKDLWFIGTMNTADRSIALVDAALRRRFHFVPFFPDHGPMAGLLERWLAARAEPAWVGDVVAMVNDELTEALGGPHLQLGPRHFMKPGIDEAVLRRIWQYNIEPFIEDQFFGDPTQIERFRFAAVLERYRDQAGVPDDAALETATVPDDPLGSVEGGATP
jgi:5-methylcytosine-specific restriction protein B